LVAGGQGWASETRVGTRTVRAISYNVWGLPSPILKDGSRFKDIARILPRLGADVVAFQETFTKKAKVLAEIPEYPHVAWGNPKKGLRFSSGLLIVSKYPILESNRSLYTVCKGFDCWARKGALHARIQFPDIGEVNVYNTHLNAEGDDELRLEQIVQFVDFIKRTSGGKPVIVLGDFNYEAKSRPDRAFRYWLDLVDSHAEFAEQHPDLLPLDRDGFSYDYRRNRHIYSTTQRPVRIDFAYFQDERQRRVSVETSRLVFDAPVSGRYLSDHFGVLTDLNLPY
jgi:endonuclease/exonuclease/phosphatase family metal-dependent hydrolase